MTEGTNCAGCGEFLRFTSRPHLEVEGDADIYVDERGDVEARHDNCATEYQRAARLVADNVRESYPEYDDAEAVDYVLRCLVRELFNADWDFELSPAYIKVYDEAVRPWHTPAVKA